MSFDQVLFASESSIRDCACLLVKASYEALFTFSNASNDSTFIEANANSNGFSVTLNKLRIIFYGRNGFLQIQIRNCLSSFCYNQVVNMLHFTYRIKNRECNSTNTIAANEALKKSGDVRLGVRKLGAGIKSSFSQIAKHQELRQRSKSEYEFA